MKAFSSRSWVRTAILIGALLVGAGIVVPIAYWRGGEPGAVSAGVALVTCLLSGLLALALAQLLDSPQLFLLQVLLGMAPRMGIPLGVMIIVEFRGGALAGAGFAYYLLVFYFITLATETILMARGLSHQRPKSQVG